MNEYIEQYVEIRDKLVSQLHSMVEVYLTGIWDPLMHHISEVQKLIAKELTCDYPEFPEQYLPNLKIKVDESIHFIEASVQAYLNVSCGLTFLGNTEYGGMMYDLYCRDSWDPQFSHVLYARYGHDEASFDKGAKEPAAEYMMGKMTPLSIAYGFAVDEGYIA